MSERTTRIYLDVTYDDEDTDPEQIAEAFDIMVEVVNKAQPGILETCGQTAFEVFCIGDPIMSRESTIREATPAEAKMFKLNAFGDGSPALFRDLNDHVYVVVGSNGIAICGDDDTVTLRPIRPLIPTVASLILNLLPDDVQMPWLLEHGFSEET